MNEADTCRKYVVPKLRAAGWETEPHSLTEQRSFTDVRIVVGNKSRRQASMRADYLLCYTRDFHKTRPARLFLDRMARDPESVIPAAIQDRVECLCKQLNAAVAKIASTGRAPFSPR